MSANCKKLVDSYLRWLAAKTAVRELGDGVCEITTPFLDRHNDRLQIYVKPAANGFLLTDDGYILGDLESSGCSVNTKQRTQILESILNGFGVSQSDGALVAEASVDDFPKKKHALIQAMLAVNDMHLTAKHRVESIFWEDVGEFLDAIGARYIPNPMFTGKTGYAHRFDYVIPRSAAEPERLLRAINRPTRQAAESLLFAWNDTRENRPEASRLYAILNDTVRGSEGERVNPGNGLPRSVISAFQRYEVRPILWSQRERFASELAE